MAQKTDQRKKLLGRILKDMGKVSESQVQEALAIQNERGGAIGNILVDLGYIDGEELTLALAKQSGMEVVNLSEMEIPPDVINRVSPAVAHAYQVVPIRYENGVLTVALADPTHLKTLDDLRFLLNCELEGAVSNEADVNQALADYYSSQEDIESVLEEVESEA
ncbi:MAG: pilus assembly protein PilB, partial [Planctomycetota bacterium]